MPVGSLPRRFTKLLSIVCLDYAVGAHLGVHPADMFVYVCRLVCVSQHSDRWHEGSCLQVKLHRACKDAEVCNQSQVDIQKKVRNIHELIDNVQKTCIPTGEGAANA